MNEEREATQSWQVGAGRITAVVEAQTDGIPNGLFFPETDATLVQGID